ncbi:MAG: hypothetical protein ABF968_05005 [Acetobacter sp.]|uniref:hypothetical protein n=1 Tax=Acetobacter sp. TaxID=440 RepID=UPI0039EB5798
MSETKFTPGPWIAFKGAGWCISRPNARMAHMVGMRAHFSMVSAENDDEKEAQANAHLIAAAPDLYEALKGLIKILSDRGVELDCMSSPTPLIKLLNTEEEEAVVEMANSALAKARGETD